MKMTTDDLLQAMRYTGKRWLGYDEIQQILTQAEGDPVSWMTTIELVKEMTDSGMLGQRVHPTGKFFQFIVA